VQGRTVGSPLGLFFGLILVTLISTTLSSEIKRLVRQKLLTFGNELMALMKTLHERLHPAFAGL